MWVVITLAAAVFQIARTSRQHRLRSLLSSNAAGFVRYAYGAPLALLLSGLMFGVLRRDLPHVPASFWPTIIAAGVAQIIGTIALLRSFRMRDFAIGTVYSKSEVLIVAALGAVGVGKALRASGWIGALLVTFGVAWLASKGSLMSLLRKSGDPAALMGLMAGAGFGLAAIGIRSASRALTGAPSFDRAVVTLTVLLVIQTAINLMWFACTDRGEIGRAAAAWRQAIWVGVFSLLGSIGWSWAFTLQSAAKVRTLGQVELIIAFAVARITLGERHTWRDYAAGAVVLMGVALVAVLG
jgi:drug/metabolite transporter (DMT)-like permease